MANARRLELHEILCELLGNRNVYYNPPETVKMQYDAIRYSLGKPEARFANDKRYSHLKCYELIVISRSSDPDVVDSILELPYTSMGKPYTADGLSHYPITIYY